LAGWSSIITTAPPAPPLVPPDLASFRRPAGRSRSCPSRRRPPRRQTTRAVVRSDDGPERSSEHRQRRHPGPIIRIVWIPHRPVAEPPCRWSPQRCSAPSSVRPQAISAPTAVGLPFGGQAHVWRAAQGEALEQTGTRPDCHPGVVRRARPVVTAVTPRMLRRPERASVFQRGGGDGGVPDHKDGASRTTTGSA
jgi:hypothetical protein